MSFTHSCVHTLLTAVFAARVRYHGSTVLPNKTQQSSPGVGPSPDGLSCDRRPSWDGVGPEGACPRLVDCSLPIEEFCLL